MGQFYSPSRQTAREVKRKRQKKEKKVGAAVGPAGPAGRDASRPARRALGAAQLSQAMPGQLGRAEDDRQEADASTRTGARSPTSRHAVGQ
jgi:hypothetical protein